MLMDSGDYMFSGKGKAQSSGSGGWYSKIKGTKKRLPVGATSLVVGGNNKLTYFWFYSLRTSWLSTITLSII